MYITWTWKSPWTFDSSRMPQSAVSALFLFESVYMHTLQGSFDMGVPFLYAHKRNEEVHFILEVNGFVFVDREVFYRLILTTNGVCRSP